MVLLGSTTEGVTADAFEISVPLIVINALVIVYELVLG